MRKTTCFRIAAVVIGLASPFFLAGCNPEADAVRQAYEDCEAAHADHDGPRVAELLAPEIFTHSALMLKYALDGTPDKIKKLTPIQRSEIIMMRNRCTLEQLEQMTGREWEILGVNNGWFEADNEFDIEISLGRVTVRGNTATAKVLADGRNSGFRYAFVKDGDQWKVDYREAYEVWNEWIREEARYEGMKVDELLMMWEEEDWDNELTKKIWDPLR